MSAVMLKGLSISIRLLHRCSRRTGNTNRTWLLTDSSSASRLRDLYKFIKYGTEEHPVKTPFTTDVNKQELKQSLTILKQTFPRCFLLAKVRNSKKDDENKQFIKENIKIFIYSFYHQGKEVMIKHTNSSKQSISIVTCNKNLIDKTDGHNKQSNGVQKTSIVTEVD